MIDDPGNAGSASQEWRAPLVADDVIDGPPDGITSWLRTVVPVAWGALLTFLLSRFPDLHAALFSPVVTMAVTGAVVTVWYSVWRWLEPRLPNWLTRLLLGSSRMPSYGALPPAGSGL